jgi:hypothetical protein
MCRSTVLRFVKASEVIRRHPRPALKSSKSDPHSEWATTRFHEVRQLKSQLHSSGVRPVGPVSEGSPIHIDGLIFLDEHHENTVIGPVSKMETLLCTNELGELATEEEGGHFSESNPRRTTKFTTSVGACFGVAIRRNDSTGELEGVKIRPFFYRNRTVVGMTTFEEHLQAETARVLPLRGVWKEVGYGYCQRYGDVWESEVKKVVDKSYCSVQDIMDHVILECDAIYRGTVFEGKYHMFHDALPQWWELLSQRYLTERGFEFRQVRIIGLENRNSRYHLKLVGNSPELCRGLDSHGFADLKQSVRLHCALSSVYRLDDARRFDLSTINGVQRAMERCWELVPTSERIVEDIMALPRVLDKIIESEGCLVKVSLCVMCVS